MTVVYGPVVPDVLGKSLTSCVVKLLESGGKTPVKDLQEEIMIIWNETQKEHSKKIQYIPNVEYNSPDFPDTLFPYGDGGSFSPGERTEDKLWLLAPHVNLRSDTNVCLMREND